MTTVKGKVRKLLRKSETIQDLYEAWKNSRREEVIRQVIPRGGVGAELGVHKGHLTPHLVEWIEPDKLYVVDPWHLLGPTWEWAAGDKSTVNGLRRVMRRIRSHMESGRAEIVVADDREFLAGLDDGHLDWVYLDSSHMYDETIEELRLLVRKVKKGGVIAGDDWQSEPGHRHHGVCRALREFEGAGLLNIFYASDTDHQWAARV